MTDRAQIARQTAGTLREFASQIDSTPIVIGFDGFVDSIIDVVAERKDMHHYTPMATIDQLGHKILAAAGHSANYELVTKMQKLGGNGPIMANAMATAGFDTTYIGALGYPEIHPVFDEFAKSVECLSVAEPGYTDALEFTDGKLMLGKHDALLNVNWDRLCEVVTERRLKQVVGRCRLVGGTNWTMLPNMSELWRRLIDDVLPHCPQPEQGRIIFVDLADPEKRERADLLQALHLMTEFQDHAQMTLGLNLKESTQVLEVLDLPVPSDPEAAIEQTAAAIREKMAIQTVVVHPRSGAAGAMLTDTGVQTASFAGPFVKHPKLSTGAGDNFNAGFCLGLLAGLTLEGALCTGTGTSGYYVRNAASPTLDQLAEFCDDLPAPQ